MRLSVMAGIGALLLGVASPAQASNAPTHHIWAVQLNWTQGGQAWSEQTLGGLRGAGVTDVEINLAWNAIEPARGQFDFSLLDADLANAHAAGLGVVPIFWQAVWGGNPASWISRFDVTSTDAAAVIPTWWDPQERQDYFDYVTTTVRHIAGEPGFDGAFLDYGWLDAMWGQPPHYTGITGYAPADIDRFHEWLPTQYGSIDAFNRKFGTDYSVWSDVPAAKPGEPLFSVFNTFRIWSVGETYGELTGLVRDITDKPLYYYWGGDLSHAIQYGNIPDIFFQLAKRYGVTVVLDDAESAGLAVFFASLAATYQVPLLLEWTPAGDRTGLTAEAAGWLSHTGIALSQLRGVDFFLYGGGTEYDVGFPAFTRWKALFEQAAGDYPRAPVALYVRFAPAYGNDPTDPANPFDINYTFARVSNITQAIKAAWQGSRVPFAVVTDQELRAGVASLRDYRAVLPVDGTDRNIAEYVRSGGRTLANWTQLDAIARPFAALTPSAGIVDIVPTVDPGSRTAWIAIAQHSPRWPYDGSIQLRYGNLGLPAGGYRLIDLATGQPIAAKPTSAGLCVPVALHGGDLTLWRLEPGSGPVASAPCPSPPSTEPPVATATAGASPDDLAFLAVGAAQRGSDGNLSLITQDGVPAIATWTLAQSGAEPAGAYAYLQLNPSNPVYPLHRVTVDVTYWATPRQGFTLQYDGSHGNFQTGPQVTSPGTNTWATAHLAVPDAWFSEGQNIDADFRLAVTDPNTPLLIRDVTVRR